LINFILLVWLVSLELKSKKGTTALIKAVKYGQYKFAKILLNLTVNVDLQDIYGNTALHYAVKENNVNLVYLLLFYKASKTIKNLNG